MRGTIGQVLLHEEAFPLNTYLEIEKIKVHVRGEKSIDQT